MEVVPDKMVMSKFEAQRIVANCSFTSVELAPMEDTLVKRSSPVEIDPGKQELLKAYRLMVLARVLDDKLASLYRMGKIHGGVFLGRGQEAVSVATGIWLRKGDVFAPLIRDGAGRLAFGETLLDALRTCLGSRLGPMKGRDGNVHRGRPLQGLLPMISHLGAMISVVNGVLLAQRMKGIGDCVGAASIGDGATSTGAFHEAINQAAVEKLPLVLVVSNNRYAYSTPNERQFACRLLDKAAGYGISGVEVDGTDLFDCMDKIGAAVRAARGGKGPQYIVADLLRLCGHGEHDDATYVDTRLKTCSLGRDCIGLAEMRIIKAGLAAEAQIREWKADAVSAVEAAVAQVQQEPSPDPYREDWCALSRTDLIDGNPDNPGTWS
jgi:acetoin:2,6-dichlorophenolindophenol oxidoreductase subunit alpha